MSKTGTPTDTQGELSPGDDSRVPKGDARQPNILGQQTMLASIIAISVGAALGALFRWYLANQLNAQYPNLPLGTLAANLIGGYFIGIAVAVVLAYPTVPPLLRLFFITGCMGGLTTFSTFSAEVVTALLGGRLIWAGATVLIHVTGSIVTTLLGIGTVRLIRPI
jgi:CrcB protein